LYIKSSLFTAIFLAALLLACTTTGPGGKTSLIFIPTSQEVAIGSGMAKQIAATEKILQDEVWQNYVAEVGRSIVDVCDRKDLEYHFTVIESDQINAFAAPGGYIYFYTGLLRQMENEAEMAAVVAHEISHVVARHGIKRLQTAIGVAVAYDLTLGGEDLEAIETAIGIGMGLVFAGYSRSNEYEADDYGMTYLTRAGYDPRAMESMLGKLAALGESSSNVFEKLSRSHPETQDRIRHIQTRIKKMQPISTDVTVGQERYQKALLRLSTKGDGQ